MPKLKNMTDYIERKVDKFWKPIYGSQDIPWTDPIAQLWLTKTDPTTITGKPTADTLVGFSNNSFSSVSAPNVKDLNKPMTAPQWPQPIQTTAPTSSNPTGIQQSQQIKIPKLNIPNISSPEGYRQAWEQNILKQWAMEQEKIMQKYQDTIGTLKFQEAQTSGKFSNADLVTKNIQNVMDQFKQWVMDPLQISRNTGISVDRVNNIIRGKWFDELQLSPWYEQEVNKPLNQALGDLETEKTRYIQDYNISKERLQKETQRTLDDMLLQFQKNQYATELAWWLSGMSGSSGFEFWIQSLQQDFNKMQKRLQQDTDFQNNEMLKAKTRMLEDYTNQVSKIKDSFNKRLADLKMQAWLSLVDIQSKYWLATEQTSQALQQLYTSIEWQQMNIYNQSLNQMKTLHQMSMDQMDMMNKQQQWRYMNVWGWRVFDTQTGQMVDPTSYAYQQQQTQQKLTSYLDQYEVWDKWWQCGSFVNNYLQTMGIWRIFKNSRQSKKDLKNSDTPTVWSIAIIDTTARQKKAWQVDKDWQPFWHVGIVVWVNQDWTLQVVDSNYSTNNDEKVRVRTVRPSEVYGYYDPSLAKTSTNPATGQQNQTWTFKPEYSSLYDNFLFGKVLSDDKLKQVWGLETFAKEARNYFEAKVKPEALAYWYDVFDPTRLITAQWSGNTDKLMKVLASQTQLKNNFEELRNLVKEHWTEMFEIWVWKEMQQKVNNIMAELKKPEYLDLWVLNAGDVPFMEALITNPVWFWQRFTTSSDQLIKLINNAEQQFTGIINKWLESKWIRRAQTTTNPTPTSRGNVYAN